MKDKDTDVRWQRAKKHLTELEEKYCSLVWYARSNKNELLLSEIYEGLAAMNEIESLYKDDINNLLNDEENWHHGFNSGMLAGVRLVLGMMSKELIEIDQDELDGLDDIIDINGVKYVEYDAYQDSIDEFPFLDT